jgi:hypothetical protein
VYRSRKSPTRRSDPEKEKLKHDPAMALYFAVLAQKGRNYGYITPKSIRYGLSAATKFLNYLGLPITDSAVSQLVSKTRKQHCEDYSTDDSLILFAGLQPIKAYSHYASLVKGTLRANRAPLYASARTNIPYSLRSLTFHPTLSVTQLK